uniref:Uncharacterized protein n=1 Tax=Solanum lycopersicum TaxID=4081 RepID=A0A3Q7HZK3_SOLLC
MELDRLCTDVDALAFAPPPPPSFGPSLPIVGDKVLLALFGEDISSAGRKHMRSNVDIGDEDDEHAKSRSDVLDFHEMNNAGDRLVSALYLKRRK